MNWMRENVPPSTDAVDLIASVFASPGTPSIRRCPPESRQTSSRSSISFLAGDHPPDLEQRLFELGQVLPVLGGRTVLRVCHGEPPARCLTKKQSTL